jgi:cephalosporin hydroxylase
MNPHDPKDPAAIARMAADPAVRSAADALFVETVRHRYSYNFSWLGRPIIQYPQDIVALQEIVWRVRPEVIVETGIAHGGSLILSASLLQLLGGEGEVIGVDIDIRPHNRVEIEAHPLARRITMIQGSSVDEEIVRQVRDRVAGRRALVILDSNHTREHVARELELYSPMVASGSYLIVFDTVIEDLPKELYPDRSWGPGDSPKTAVREFLAKNPRFEVDAEMDGKLLMTVAPEGYLRCIAD